MPAQSSSIRHITAVGPARPARALRLGRIEGVDIFISLGGLLLYLSFTTLLPLTHRGSGFLPGESEGVRWAASAAINVWLVISILMHEFCHVAAARSVGIPVSLVVVGALGGRAHPEREIPLAGQEFRIAVLAPLWNVGCAAVFVFLWRNQFNQFGSHGELIVGYLAVLELAIIGTNLVPIYPLDGGVIAYSMLWAITGSPLRGIQLLRRFGRIIGATAFALWGLLLLLVGSPLWAAIFFGLAWVFWSVASSSCTAEAQRLLLGQATVFQYMVTDIPTVAGDSLVSQVTQSVKSYAVVRAPSAQQAAGEVIGLITNDDIARVPLESRDKTTVQEMIAATERLAWVSPDESFRECYTVMRIYDVQHAIVLRSGQVEGMITFDRNWQIPQQTLRPPYDAAPAA